MGIADALSLTLSPLEKDENLLRTIPYFWSDALNYFLFGHGPMTPTLMDVVMITRLDISSPNPSTFSLTKVPYVLSSKGDITSWGAYMGQHFKSKGSVDEREHTAFMNMWLEHFLSCSPSLAPTRNYVSLAYDLAIGHSIGLGKVFLGEVYRLLHLSICGLLGGRSFAKVAPGGLSNCGLIFTFRVISPIFLL